MPNAEVYYQYVRERFQAEGKPDIAQGQMAYMRHQFEFFGLKAPHWVALSKEIFYSKRGGLGLASVFPHESGGRSDLY
jgi:hypothetical protein